MEVAGDELCSLSPGDNVDEIGLLLFTLSLEAAIDRNGESGDCDTGSGGTQLGIGSESTHNYCNVKHLCFLTF